MKSVFNPNQTGYVNAIRAAVLSSLLCLAGCGPTQEELIVELRMQQAAFEQILVAIERYKDAKGAYPETLREVNGLVVPSITISLKSATLYSLPLKYEVSRNRDFFRVIYGISDKDDYELGATSSYLSTAKKWDTSSYIGPMHHVEARHYGTQYTASRSRKQLELAVLSLLDAAKANSAYPCRNFWQDWINKNIGTGESANPALPNVGQGNESRMYVAENGEPVYGFVFAKRLYRPMTKSLSIVIAVYRFQGKNIGWKLVQACDSSPGR